ncbi:MAG: helix-hairpin-helix domain-containing protein [Dermatophilaceae bacterium]
MRDLPDRFWERVRVAIPQADVPVVQVPESLRRPRLDVSRRQVLAVGGAAVVALLVLALRLAVAQAGAEPVPVSATPAGLVSRSVPSALASGGAASGGGASGGVGAGAGSGPDGATAQIVVHIVGQVAHPGLVTLPAGARVADAIRAAGGALETADLGGVNLARILVDAEQVVVPKPGEWVPSSSGGAPTGGGSGSGGLVNLNAATLSDLDGLPGIGPVLAQRILDWRTEHQRFSSVDELGEVPGIGPKLLAQLRSKVRV